MTAKQTARTSPTYTVPDAPASVGTPTNGSHTSAEPMKGISKRGQKIVAVKTFGVYSRARVSGGAN